MHPTEITQLLSRLIAFDTTSRNSNLELIAFVETFLSERGVTSKRIPSPDATKANLIATIGPQDVPGYVLSAHTDVVPVDDQAWSSDPFQAVIRDKHLYGRGACDMKGFLASVLANVDRFAAAPLKKPIHLAFSYDEEIGCIGARDIVAEMAEWPVRPAACFVGEPTCMEVIVAHKAKRSLRVTVRGRTAHSSLAPHAVNAVEYAARLIVHINEVGRRLAASGLRDDLFDVPVTTSHVGRIAGGVQLNIVPDTCTFDFEFRALPQDDADALVREVKAFAADVLEPEMQAIAPEAGIAFETISAFPGLDTHAEDPVTVLAKALSGRNSHAKVAYGTEAGLFSGIAGIPTIVCGPGSIEQAHKADEFIALEQLERCDQFLRNLTDHACR